MKQNTLMEVEISAKSDIGNIDVFVVQVGLLANTLLGIHLPGARMKLNPHVSLTHRPCGPYHRYYINPRETL